ncbi:peptidoglycan DD-metalloendopeptidase family protein [Raineyella sp. LH-20]|uniref:peptidoglycan DD-metalloendopeptidase family protein n=1 Tax=Raineyella sp. LH-20 TaxID=3081204 RepID=UPI0029555808|nr:peptidoglycan DD-metalloendopeptidase family protein [Raineyella sp. LH-20]WOP18762.1 peptidoglycan DD-metalloendopeptidase family protein [Raineyella sp. LH-20]
MSRIPTPSSHPRRAVAADDSSESTLGSPRAPITTLRDRFQQPAADGTPGRYAQIDGGDETDDNRHTLNTSLAALTVSALGLAVAGAVTLTSNAQAANPEAVLAAQQRNGGSPTVAQPAPASAADTSNGGGAANTSDGQSPAGGALDGRSTDGTSRTAARTELDAAMSAQLATERSKQLSAANNSATEASISKASASRSALLNDAKKATSSQNEQLKTPTGTLSGAAARSATMSVAASGGGGATPLKPGTYTLGARFGAVGSWSRYHTGQDFPAPIGTPIYAAAAGVIAPANGGSWAGNHVVIDHPGGGATLYAHMSSTAVRVGQQVQAGQLIGYVGVTGRSFGPHLHWEYYPNAKTVGDPYTAANPVPWLAARGVAL